jgi:hypothetical protein
MDTLHEVLNIRWTGRQPVSATARAKYIGRIRTSRRNHSKICDLLADMGYVHVALLSE